MRSGCNPDVLHNVILVDKLYYSSDRPIGSTLARLDDDATRRKLESEFLRRSLRLAPTMWTNTDWNNVEIDRDSNSSRVQSRSAGDGDNLQSFSTFD